MTTQDDDQAPSLTPTEKLAALVAKRKAKSSQNAWGGGLHNERAAAARSASKSKPALRK